MRLTAKVSLLLLFFDAVITLTVEDVYERLLEKNRNVEDTFSARFIQPIGVVGGDLIWPRSYTKPSFLIFDNDGATYNVPIKQPSLSEIIARTSVSG